MNVFDLVATLTLDSSEYERSLNDARGKAEGSGNAMGTAMKAVGAGIAAATTAVVAFTGESVKVGAAFDSSMSQVAATMGYTVEELNTAGSDAANTFEQLSNFAQEMGSSTAFSASQAADALNYMALAGYDADTSMQMLPNVLNLAAAGGIELAAASDMVTDAQSALGLSLSETADMVDQMAAASSKSNTSVAQLGDAMLTIGATARNVKGGTQELSTVLGVLADNGIKGAEGGTHLRNMILSLQSPTADGVAALEQLGVAVYDADGNMRSMIDIIGDMQTGLDGMDQASKDAVIGGIFNKTDLAAVNALLGTSSERFDELSAAIGDSAGAAQAMADVQLDNLEGDVTLFQSALEGAQIAISDGLMPNLREFVQFGTDGISTLTEAFREGGLSGAMDALGGVIADGVAMIMESLPTMVDAGVQLMMALGQGLIQNLPAMTDAAMQIILTIINGITTAVPQLMAILPPLVAQLAGQLIQNLPLMINAGLQLLVAVITGLANAIPQLVGYVPQIIAAIVSTLINNLPQIINSGVQVITALINGLIQALPSLIAMTPQIIMAIVTTLAANLPQIIQGGVQIVGSLIEGLLSMLGSLVSAAVELGQSIINAVMNLPSQMLSIGKNIVEGIWNGISGSLSWIKSKITGWVGNVLSFLKGLFGIHSPSTVMRDVIGKNLALGIGEGFTGEMKNVEKQMEKAMPDFETMLPDMNAAVSFTRTGSKGIGAGDTTYNDITINIDGSKNTKDVARELFKQLKRKGVAVGA